MTANVLRLLSIVHVDVLTHGNSAGEGAGTLLLFIRRTSSELEDLPRIAMITDKLNS